MASKTMSTGQCVYCKKSVTKNYIKRHLESCLERQTATEAANAKPKAKKTRLFHLQVEGDGRSMYWMHLEVPVTATLHDLDDFLRQIWLECCGHLSAFEMENKRYTVSLDDGGMFPSDMVWLGAPFAGAPPPAFAPNMLPPPMMVDAFDEPAIDAILEKLLQEQRALVKDESAEQFIQNLIKTAINQFMTELEQSLIQSMTLDVEALLGASVKKLSAKEMLKGLDEAEAKHKAQPPNALFDFSMLPPEFLKNFQLPEEYDMNVALGEVLSVGQKFFHEYDFGSTTELMLKVVGEREGVSLGTKKNPVQILARNEPPAIPCSLCGQPATVVCANCNWGGMSPIEEGVLCKKCAKKHPCGEEMLLPIVNSPRFGVCGYTGEATGW